MTAGAEASPAAAPVLRGRLADYLELTKPRIAVMVLVSTLAGFYMAAPSPIDPILLAATLLGTGLVGGGASALNMTLERRHDALMERTRARPLPAGRMGVGEAFAFGGGIAALGLAILAAETNALACVVAAASFALYVFVYTPLKRLTELNTLVGAAPGALPPLIGWAAAAGALPGPAWSIFAILFFWQLPHFFAIAWLHREDYSAGGFRMISVGEGAGDRLGLRVIGHTIALVVASLTPTFWGLAGRPYFFVALALGIGFLAFGAALSRRRDKPSARALLLYSVVYLPLLFAAMMLWKA